MSDVQPVPAVRLDNEDVWNALEPRIKDLVLRGAFTLGPELEEFEAAAAAAFGCGWAVGTSSGTSALFLALRAAPLPPGARVAMPANTFFATFEAAALAGFTPVIVDHDDDYLIDLDALARVQADAVIPVHLYGLPVDMVRLRELAAGRGWWVLEDCSQAHGATVAGRPIGSFGDAAAFSAYPTKNLGAWGDAGFVTGSDPAVEKTIRSLRHHGQATPNVHGALGGTERLDNLQALVLTEKLERLPRELERRRSVAARYREVLEETIPSLPGDRDGRTHAYHQFVVQVDERDEVLAYLRAQGVGASVHYPHPVHLQPAAKGRCEVPARPEVAEATAARILSLPIYPSLRDDEIERVATVLKEVLAR
ncbi:MAG: DegT/DnrJ/EryC1/StrS family aminotransferase [Actinomycetota bacterium]|nr:DegT/DnrJ/EryC1/StrS family aminotransferase [Actinomycetota bacterium]